LMYLEQRKLLWTTTRYHHWKKWECYCIVHLVTCDLTLLG